MPNFLLIGAGKSGTSSLYLYLKQHPEIYMSPLKEPHFFSFEGEKLNFSNLAGKKVNQKIITDLDNYTSLFSGVTDEKAIGEASPSYIYYPKASERIKHYIPDTKIIAILRHPIDRAYSDYLMYYRRGQETINFIQAVRDEQAGKRKNWFTGHYVGGGFYYKMLKRYFDNFDRSQIKVLFYQDLRDKPLNLMQDIYKFLEVDDKFIPDVSLKTNVSPGIPKSRALYSFLMAQNNPIKPLLKSLLPANLLKLRQRMIESICYKPPQLTPEIRGELISVFKQDTLKLEELIQRELSEWYKV